MSREHAADDFLGGRGIFDMPALRRLVEGDVEADIARRGHAGCAVEDFGELAGEAVRAVMAAEQRHRHRTVLRHGENRRLAPLVGDAGRKRAHQDTGGADADDARTLGEQAAQVHARVGKARVAFGDAALEAVDRGSRQGITDLFRHLQSALGEDDDGEGLAGSHHGKINPCRGKPKSPKNRARPRR